MKLLFDQSLSFKLCERLSDLFPGSSQARLIGLERAHDGEIWDYAEANGFTLVTHDSDFAEMAALFGPPPKVIWLRSGNQSTADTEAVIRRNADIILAFGSEPDTACLEVYWP